MFTEIIMEQMNLINEACICNCFGMYVEVDSNKGRNGKGYFKVYNNENKNGASAMIRISIDPVNPDYVYHVNPTLPGSKNKLKDFSLSSKDKRNLVLMLSKNDNWDNLLGAIAKFQGIPIDNIGTLEIPDYTKLKYDKSKSKN